MQRKWKSEQSFVLCTNLNNSSWWETNPKKHKGFFLFSLVCLCWLLRSHDFPSALFVLLLHSSLFTLAQHNTKPQAYSCLFSYYLFVLAIMPLTRYSSSHSHSKQETLKIWYLGLNNFLNFCKVFFILVFSF